MEITNILNAIGWGLASWSISLSLFTILHACLPKMTIKQVEVYANATFYFSIIVGIAVFLINI